jgi:hypothetical protein
VAEIVHAGAPVLIVPMGCKPMAGSFVNFLWDQEITAFLVKPEWVGQPESGETGLGLRVAPGSA